MYPVRMQMFRQNLESNLGAAQFTPPEIHAFVEKATALIASAEQVFPDRFFNIESALHSISKDKSLSLAGAKLALLANPAILFEKAGLPTRAPGEDIPLVSSRRHLGFNGTEAARGQVAVPVRLNDEQKRLAAQLAAQPRQRTMEEIRLSIRQGVNYGPKSTAVQREPRVLDDGMEGVRPRKEPRPAKKPRAVADTDQAKETKDAPKASKGRNKRMDDDAIFSAMDQSMTERGRLPTPPDSYMYLPAGHAGWGAIGNYMRTVLKTTQKTFYQEKKAALQNAQQTVQQREAEDLALTAIEEVTLNAVGELALAATASVIIEPAAVKKAKSLFNARDVFQDCVRHIGQNKALPKPGVFYHFVCGKNVDAIDRAFKKGAVEGLEIFIGNASAPPRTTAEFLVAAGIAENKDGQVIPRPAKIIQQRLSELNIA